MSCPKCGRHVDEDAVICPGCDFIIDSSFLGDDITNAMEAEAEKREPSLVVENPLLSSAGYGQDDLILGDGEGDFEAFESQNTGLAREVTHARIFVGGAASELLRPDAIPGPKEGVDPTALKLTPFEVHVLSLCNAYRPVGRIRKKSGMTDAEVHTSLAMLHDKGVIALVGHVSEERKARARKRRRARRRKEREQSSDLAFDLDTAAKRIDEAVAAVAAQKEDADVIVTPAPKRAADIPSVVEKTVLSVAPSAPPDSVPPPEPAADAAPSSDPFAPAPTGDVDLDALAAGAAADAVAAVDADGDDSEGAAMSEQELLLSMAEGAVSEVASESQASGAEDQFDLDAIAQDGASGNFETPSRDVRMGADPGPDLQSEHLADMDADLDPVSVDENSALPLDASEPRQPAQDVLEALADEFDGSELEPTGAADLPESSLDVGSIDIASIADGPIDIQSIDIASADMVSAEEMPDVSGPLPPPLPSAESIPIGFSLEEDPDLADALLDSEEGLPVDDAGVAPGVVPGVEQGFGVGEEEQSIIRPAAKVAPAMSSARAVRTAPKSNAPSPPVTTPLPGQGAPPALPGGVPPLPGAGLVPPLPGAQGALDIDSGEDGGISLEGFSVEDSSEEQEVAPAAAPAAQAPAPPAAAPSSSVSFEMQRKARLIFEQAQKDMAEGRPSSALMNAKLACIYDPSEADFKIALDAWQNQSMSNVARPKELILFEEAKEAELAGEYENAVALLRQALDLNPRAAPIYNRLGVILATRLKQYPPASQALLQACELDPGNLAYKNNLGKILVMEEKEVDSKRSKRGLADRILGNKEEGGVRVRTIRPKQF